jgi:hypothetical protein
MSFQAIGDPRPRVRAATEWKKEAAADARQALALARQDGDPWLVSFCLSAAYSTMRSAHLRLPPSDLAEAISLARETGDRFLLCRALNAMGECVTETTKDPEAAIPWYQESLRIARETGNKLSMLESLHGLGVSHIYLHRPKEAKSFLSEGLQVVVELGARGSFVWVLGGLDYVARIEGRRMRAMKLMGAAQQSALPEIQWQDAVDGFQGPPVEMDEEPWRLGRAMTLDEAVTYALSDDD